MMISKEDAKSMRIDDNIRMLAAIRFGREMDLTIINVYNESLCFRRAANHFGLDETEVRFIVLGNKK